MPATASKRSTATVRLLLRLGNVPSKLYAPLISAPAWGEQRRVGGGRGGAAVPSALAACAGAPSAQAVSSRVTRRRGAGIGGLSPVPTR